jgi:hypothetical protein
MRTKSQKVGSRPPTPFTYGVTCRIAHVVRLERERERERGHVLDAGTAYTIKIVFECGWTPRHSRYMPNEGEIQSRCHPYSAIILAKLISLLTKSTLQVYTGNNGLTILDIPLSSPKMKCPGEPCTAPSAGRAMRCHIPTPRPRTSLTASPNRSRAPISLYSSPNAELEKNM